MGDGVCWPSQGAVARPGEFKVPITPE